MTTSPSPYRGFRFLAEVIETAGQHRAARNAAFCTWREVTGIAGAA